MTQMEKVSGGWERRGFVSWRGGDRTTPDRFEIGMRNTSLGLRSVQGRGGEEEGGQIHLAATKSKIRAGKEETKLDAEGPLMGGDLLKKRAMMAPGAQASCESEPSRANGALR